MNHEKKIHQIWLMLKVTYGVTAILAGLDKFGFNYIVDWGQYVSPQLYSMVPMSDIYFMYLIGIVEVIVGILILSKLTRIGAYLMALWLIAISLNLFTMGMYYDIAIRDIVMAVGAIALAQLDEIMCDICAP